jgi:hypothetical protein
MIRLNLLRGLPPVEPPSEPESPGTTSGSLKQILAVLLVLLVGGTLAVWLAKPEWVNWDLTTGFGLGDDKARADSLRLVEARNLQVSRLVEARQTAAIEWLAHLEATLSGAAHAGTLTLTRSAFAASGEFALEGTSTTAEALSALQEGLVLVPGLNLRESRATEIAGARGLHFVFKFAGHIDYRVADVPIAPVMEADSTSQTVQATTADRPPKNRVVAPSEVQTALETLMRSAQAADINFAEPGIASITRSGAMNLHAWRLKSLGAAVSTADSLRSDSTLEPSIFGTLREIVEGERFRGSPFAIQRVTVTERDGKHTVFLDILALTP